MVGLTFPPWRGPKGCLVVIRGYFDESYRDQRVYAIGGYIARDRDWTLVSRHWKNRRLRNKVQCFHAADCESGYEEFVHLSKQERTQLKADLIQIVHDHENLGGFAAAVMIDDFYRVQQSSARAREVLGPDPYFLCFQMLLSAICEEFERQGARPGMRVAFVFEEQEEFSGRTKALYDKFRAINTKYSERLGSLAYSPKERFIPLEMADNLAYETMKEILNKKFDPTRPTRIAMEKMIPRIRQIYLMEEKDLRKLALFGRTSKDFRKTA